ncbi:hypothetical protein [Shouchella miscanthi]|uniref:DUF4365 domain-containing protein n=1 Tax=Shouchella miscanthi TaxID=2598861 RepID=A0ABU6NPN3_9BACI|nr:DUF4365 domain-containing protein [Shouchella miscanthi]
MAYELQSSSYNEKLSINAIENHIFSNQLPIIPFINSGDKEVSFDGYLQVNTKVSDNKKDFLKKVDVQVKSKKVKRYTGKKAKFQLDIEDIKNYYKQFGCILLLVQIKDSLNMKIYYKQLLPLELYETLESTKKDGKSKSIELRELDETNLYTVCMKFIRELDKQPKALIELEEKPDKFSQMRISSITMRNELKENLTEFFDHSYTIYGVKEGIEYPLDTVSMLEIISKGPMVFVIEKINGELSKYGLNITETVKKGKNYRIIVVEDSLELEFNFKESTFKFNANKLNSLKSQLKTLPFIIEVLEEGNLYLEIDGVYKKAVINLEGREDVLDRIKHSENKVRNLARVYEKFNVDKNFVFLNEDMIDGEMDKLISVFIENEIVKPSQDSESPCFVKFNLGGSFITTFYSPKNKILYLDPFSKEINNILISAKTGDDIYISIPMYIALETELLANSLNINYKLIYDSIEIFLVDNDSNVKSISATLTNFCLRCISAYDLCNEMILLDIAKLILNKLKKLEDSHATDINLLQIEKRLTKSLTVESQTLLINMLDQSDNEEVILRFCVNVLLDNKPMADFYLKKIKKDEDEFNYLQEQPIFNLLKELL